jgi:predicted homoserine dehydrogenase-like protein
MNLWTLARRRDAEGRPVQVAVIGCGKFAAMFLTQVPTMAGVRVTGIADLEPERARDTCRRIGWDEARIAATRFTDDAMGLVAADDVEVMVEATGHPAAGVAHAKHAIAQGKHLVMVNVEADVLAGPLLAREAEAAGLVYSLAYGDQPALVAEMVDWARATGFEVLAAGKGTKYLPAYHRSTPDTVWGHYGLTAEQARAGGMNPQMFNSFLDGTKSAIEMAAIANATGLGVPEDGLTFPPCGVDDLPLVFGGGAAPRVEVVSSLERDGRPVFRDLRWGVYAVFRAPTPYAARCFKEYGLVTDPSGTVAAMYKPFHLIGLELGVSVLSAALRGEATGAPTAFKGDVVATAKRDLDVGETLDGEGGHRVWGRLTSAARSLALGGLPIGLAHGVKLVRAVARDQPLTWADVAIDRTDATYRVRREMEALFAPPSAVGLAAQ